MPKPTKPSDSEQDALPPAKAAQLRDDTLRNMLRTKPKPLKDMKVGKRRSTTTKKRANRE